MDHEFQMPVEWYPDEDEPERQAVDVDDDIIRVGDYVVVRFEKEGKKNKKRCERQFLCCINDIIPEDQTYIVQGFRAVDAKKKTFVLKDNDISSIKRDEVVAYNLPQPTVNFSKRRMVFLFDEPIKVDQ